MFPVLAMLLEIGNKHVDNLLYMFSAPPNHRPINHGLAIAFKVTELL